MGSDFLQVPAYWWVDGYWEGGGVCGYEGEKRGIKGGAGVHVGGGRGGGGIVKGVLALFGKFDYV